MDRYLDPLHSLFEPLTLHFLIISYVFGMMHVSGWDGSGLRRLGMYPEVDTLLERLLAAMVALFCHTEAKDIHFFSA